LPRLNEHLQFEFLARLIEHKVHEENIPVDGLDWQFHEAQLAALKVLRDRSFEESRLPATRIGRRFNEYLVRLRLRMVAAYSSSRRSEGQCAAE